MQEAREALAADRTAVGRQLCAAYSDEADRFLQGLFDVAVPESQRASVALVALGGYGRQELSLQSDLDVLLLHDGSIDIAPIADAIWYPIWDTGVKLGHGVRTSKEALALAGEDLDSATSLLQDRHLAGNAALTADLHDKMQALWRKRAKHFLPQMAERVRERHAAAGEVAFLLEPNIKDGRGGLRDVQSLHWASLSRELLWDGDDVALDEAYHVLLDARVELHRRTGRAGDILVLQEQDAVAEALGDATADDLMRRLSSAARTIAFRSDDAWRRIELSFRGPLSRRRRRDRELAPGIVLRDGEVHLSDKVTDIGPVLPLTVVAAAAAEDAPVHRSTLERLEVAPALPVPWPREARDALVALLATGRPAIGHLESLDQHGLLVKILPEWETVRSKPQRNAYHTFTVDRHLCEAAANAAERTDRVGRPDLLLIGAWLHDIGKGFPGDHTVVGMELLADIGARMGFDAPDIATLILMVEHHLLLPDVATRRDLDDADVIDRVAMQLGSPLHLSLMHALTEADSLATGPAAWGPWKAGLVDTLAARVDHVLGGGAVHDVTDEFPTPGQLDRMRQGVRVVEGYDDTLTIIDVDRPGLFSRVAGVLALHGLTVLDANICTVDGRAIEVISVQSSFGKTIAWDKVTADLERALDGALDIKARLADRAAIYGQARPMLARAARVEFHPDDSSRATIVEVHAPDSVGVLYRITAALAELECNIERARIQTMLDAVVDSFYVTDMYGAKLSRDLLVEVRRGVLASLG